MTLQMHGIGSPKITYKDHSTIKFDDLNTYLLLAKKAISRFGPKFYKGLSAKMLRNEDLISSIANAIMMADWRWDENYVGPNGEKKTKYSYRNQCALWAMQTFVSKEHKHSKKKFKAFSLDFKPSDNEEAIGLHSMAADPNASTPEDIAILKEEAQKVTDLINGLLNVECITERQKEYIRLYYFESYTFEKIGNKYGITREAVRQGLNKALELIRSVVNE
jgi:RNA polymerase sigma factor (sigma-70 family)